MQESTSKNSYTADRRITVLPLIIRHRSANILNCIRCGNGIVDGGAIHRSPTVNNTGIIKNGISAGVHG